MNYYEHHLGDYIRDTAHLSMIEEGAYRRLIDAYYVNEGPLPADRKKVYRTVRISKKNERAVVDSILSEFFTLTENGWNHGRCDRELDRYKAKRDKAKASAEARWKADANAMRTHQESDANAMRTQCGGNALQSPVTSNQSEKTLRSSSSQSLTSSPSGGLQGGNQTISKRAIRKAAVADAVKSIAARKAMP